MGADGSDGSGWAWQEPARAPLTAPPPPFETDPPAPAGRDRLGGGAIAGLAAGGVLLLLVGAVLGVVGVLAFGFFAADPLTVGAEDGTVAVFALEPGACGRGVPGDGGSWRSADAVACEQAHDFEVYSVEPIPDAGDTPYPDVDTLALYADGVCQMRFEPFVRRSYWDSRLDYEALVPSPRSWAAGERLLRCVVVDMGGSALTGSARGSGW
jgi:hypothetical protein